MRIERFLGHAGAGDNSVYPHRANAVAGKELISRVVYALSCGRQRKGLVFSRMNRSHAAVDRSVYQKFNSMAGAATATGVLESMASSHYSAACHHAKRKSGRLSRGASSSASAAWQRR